ncbi:hypothetical protein WHR41_06456 [Cladosporium halotolerans]|uniref:Reticulon-like protein n=1 Tax=Cladosporium halotolerans TaxID=1052096 RepID=A0AB34KJ85_9PEZI
MADTTSAPDYPDLNNQGQANGTSIKDTVTNSASNTMNSIQNSQTMQSISNGPVADKARNEAATTKNEFSNLAAARQTPNSKTATGQNLTHYHSLFYSLLSWENPRATAISFATIVTGILLARYVPLERYVLKAAFTVLGVTAAAELVGHFILGEGFATKMRPKRYYTIPRETLDSITGDLEELINFFVIEFQRILFAENVWATIAAFFTTLIGYFLVKVTPKWGLLLLSTFVVYLTPLIYIKNKELIDRHLNNAAELANKQTAQFRQVAAKNTNKAFEATSSATSQYVSMAQEYMGGAKKAAVDKGYVSKETAEKAPGAPVEKSYTDAAPAKETSAPSAPVEQPAEAAPAEKASSPVVEQPTSAEKADFPAAPTAEPHAASGQEPEAAEPLSVSEPHAAEEKKEPLVSL